MANASLALIAVSVFGFIVLLGMVAGIVLIVKRVGHKGDLKCPQCGYATKAQYKVCPNCAKILEGGA